MSVASPISKSDMLKFLRNEIFDPVLSSPEASNALKLRVHSAMSRMMMLDAYGVRRYYWSIVAGSTSSQNLGKALQDEGFTRFAQPSVVDEFNRRFASDD